MRVPGKVLDVLDGHALAEQVGDDHDAEAVRADDLGQPGVLEQPLDQVPGELRVDRSL